LKLELEQLLRASLAKLAGTVLPQAPPADAVVLERTRDAQHGDFATNVALRLAKLAEPAVPNQRVGDFSESLPDRLLIDELALLPLRFGEFGWSSWELRPCTISAARSRAAVKKRLSPSNFNSSGITFCALASMPSLETMT